MFLGHFGLALGAKKVAPETSLGSLILAAQLPDLIWPTLLLLGVERVAIEPGVTRVTPLDFQSYPYSHSLLAMALWGGLLALLHRRARGSRRGALVLAALVVSHWVLDLVVHRPDLPLAFGSGRRFGLGLWNSLPATLAVELATLAAGAGVYLAVTRRRDRTGAVALWSLLLFLLVVYLANVFGPPPPSVTAISVVGHSMWLLVLWGYWADRHRRPAAAESASP